MRVLRILAIESGGRSTVLRSMTDSGFCDSRCLGLASFGPAREAVDVFCDECGAENRDGAKWCSTCGNRLPDVGELEERDTRDRRRCLVFAAGTVAILLLGLVVATMTGLIHLPDTGISSPGSVVSREGAPHAPKDVQAVEDREPETKIAKVTIVDGSGLKCVQEYEYDNHGRCIRTVADEEFSDEKTGARGTGHWEERVRYLDDDRILYEKTVSGMPEESENGTFEKSVEMELDDRGEPVKEVTWEYDGSRVVRTDHRTYYDSGQLKSLESTYSRDTVETSDGVYGLVYGYYEYTEDGTTTTDIEEYENGTRYEKRYELDESGRCIRETLLSSPGKENENQAVYRYTYDEYGNRTAIIYEDGVVSEYVLELDEKGRVLSCAEPVPIITNAFESGHDEYWVRNEYLYDDDGNVIYRRYLPLKHDGTPESDHGSEYYYEYVLI